MDISYFILLLFSYLLGAVPFGLIIAKARGVDIRAVGSGNIGATNVFRAVGKPFGILTLILDALKGFIPSFYFPLFAGQEAGGTLSVLCGVFSIVGHNWPVYVGFRGGKGVATSAGVLIGIAPAAMGIGLGTFIATFLVTRYVAVASMGAAGAAAIAGWFYYSEGGLFLPMVLTVLGAMVIWRHRSNIERLLKGREHRFEFGDKKHEKPRMDTNEHE